jgi:tRNA nucleotidyltransferase (CCA-adding enzyme)
MKISIKSNSYVVGGAVRDIVLCLPLTDIDYVVVGSTPEEMLTQGFKQVAKDFPVFLDNTGNEYALARTERKVGVGYHGFETNSASTVTLEEDLFRRDLSINSLAVPVEDWDTFVETKDESLIIDPYNGLEDIHNRILRHTSEHFKEDPVRLLRLARFYAKYGFGVAEETIVLLKQMVADGEVHHLVPERVWAETTKALMLPNSMEYFWLLHKCDALEIVMPGLINGLVDKGFHVRKSSLRGHNFDVRCMLLFCDLKNIHLVLKDLRVPSNITDNVRLFQDAKKLLFWTLMEPSHILDFLLSNNILKQPEKLSNVSLAFSVYTEKVSYNFDRVLKSYNAIKQINFNSLSVEQQKTLKGKEIGVALNELRLEYITKFLNK